MRSIGSTSKRILIALVLLCGVLFAPTSARAESRGGTGITIRQIGKPSWKPTDFNVFSATIGTATSGYAEYLPTTLRVLPGPNHAFHPQLGVGPGEPHLPPYRHELSRGVRKAGSYDRRCFTPEQFSNGEAVIAAAMVVPHGGRHVGSSPDFKRGPIISNSLFPIHVEGVSYRNKKVFDATLVNFDVPALDSQLSPPFHVDGHSHFPFFLADNADFGPPGTKLRGTYLFDMKMLDHTGAGWSIKVSFVIRERC